jgi:hypothetical protein
VVLEQLENAESETLNHKPLLKAMLTTAPLDGMVRCTDQLGLTHFIVLMVAFKHRHRHLRQRQSIVRFLVGLMCLIRAMLLLVEPLEPNSKHVPSQDNLLTEDKLAQHSHNLLAAQHLRAHQLIVRFLVGVMCLIRALLLLVEPLEPNSKHVPSQDNLLTEDKRAQHSHKLLAAQLQLVHQLIANIQLRMVLVWDPVVGLEPEV